ncbi:hypothetical protein Dimus_007494 [Dionaea muscipula]
MQSQSSSAASTLDSVHDEHARLRLPSLITLGSPPSSSPSVLLCHRHARCTIADTTATLGGHARLHTQPYVWLPPSVVTLALNSLRSEMNNTRSESTGYSVNSTI